MSEYQLNTHDYQVRHTGCFVRLKKPMEGEAAIAYVREGPYENSAGRPEGFHMRTYKLDGDNQTELKDRKIKMVDLDLDILPTGIINTERSILHLKKYKPSGNAKYRTSLSKGTVELHDPLVHLRQKLDIRQVQGIEDYYGMQAWANNIYSTPQEALDGVKNHEYLARAFNNKFYFSLSDKTDAIVLMYVESAAGKEVDGMIILRPWAGRFKELLEGYGLRCAIEGEG